MHIKYFIALLLITTGLCGCLDPCRNVFCENGAPCVDGLCVCVEGYEGDDCGTEQREKFIGTFSVNDNCSATSIGSYVVTAMADELVLTRVSITGFKETFVNPVIAQVNGSRITIANQDPDGVGVRISGTGTATEEGVNWNYKIKDDFGYVDACNSSWIKRE